MTPATLIDVYLQVLVALGFEPEHARKVVRVLLQRDHASLWWRSVS